MHDRLERKARKARKAILAFLFAGFAAFAFQVHAQNPFDGEWHFYGGDLRNHHYSPLARLDAANFNALEVAWRFKTDSLGPRPEFELEGAPLMVLVHHPIWNMDVVTAPMLVDLTVKGQPVKAVAVMGRQAFLYLCNRVTGEPIFPIEERPVPQSDVPGEKTSPTQPFSTRPPAYHHQGVTTEGGSFRTAGRRNVGRVLSEPPEE